jgi:uncharacterized protein YegP (UPF0339 family)
VNDNYSLNADYSDARPAHWQKVITQIAVGDGSTDHKAQYHARLVGAQGEKVMVTQTYDDERSVDEAINLARRSFPGWRENYAAVNVEVVDNRPGKRVRA